MQIIRESSTLQLKLVNNEYEFQKCYSSAIFFKNRKFFKWFMQYTNYWSIIFRNIELHVRSRMFIIKAFPILKSLTSFPVIMFDFHKICIMPNQLSTTIICYWTIIVTDSVTFLAMKNEKSLQPIRSTLFRQLIDNPATKVSRTF